MAHETILVVDDNPLNLKLTRILLEIHGYKVVTATDGPAALATAEEAMPRLVLLDIELRGIDGMEVARRLKSSLLKQGVIVVALTARATSADESEARAAGCDGYIEKPIDAARFPEQVRDYLDNAAAPKKVADMFRRAASDDTPCLGLGHSEKAPDRGIRFRAR